MTQNPDIIIVAWKLHDDKGGYILNGYSLHATLDDAQNYIRAQESLEQNTAVRQNPSDPDHRMTDKPNGPLVQGGFYYLALNSQDIPFMRTLRNVMIRGGAEKALRIPPVKGSVFKRLVNVLNHQPQYAWQVHGGRKQKRQTALRF